MTKEEIQKGYHDKCKVDTKAPEHLQCPAYYTQDGWFQGARWAENQVRWKARKAFCKAVCPNGCPHIKDGVESGCCLAVDCDKLESFVNSIND